MKLHAKFVFSIGLLGLLCLLLPGSLRADDVTISFTNTIGGVSGTVTVEAEGLTAGTASAATSVILLSYPSALDPEIAYAGTNLTAWAYQDVNQFTLNSSGQLVSEEFDVAAFNEVGSVDIFILDSITPPIPPEPLTPSPIDFLGYGPYEGYVGSGPYPNAVATVPSTSTTTPEPSSLFLLGTGLLSLGPFIRRRV
ncbi:MAG: PEP-CTERM sorting domain-containing protein [Candidatus Acidiferrales bacterium]